MHINEYKLLTTRRYFSLLVVQFTNSLTDHLFKIIIAVFAFSMFTRDSMMAIAVLAFFIPFLIFSHQAGIIADTSEKSRHIRFIKFYQLLLSFVVAAAVVVNSFWLMLAAIFLFGVNGAYFLPYKHSILPQLVNKDELIAGNAFMNTMLFFAVLLASVFFNYFIDNGVFTRFLSNICLVVAMCTTCLIGLIASFFIPPAAALTEDKLSYNLFEQDKIILFCIICISWFWSANFAYLALHADYLNMILQLDYKTLELVATYVFGIAVGSLLINWLQQSEIKLAYLPVALIVFLVFSVDFYFSSQTYFSRQIFSIPLILVDLFFMGLAGGIYIVPLYATLQYRSVQAFRARNIACSSIFNAKLIIITFFILKFFEYNHFAVTTSLLIVPVTAFLLLLYIMSQPRV